jgi:hypothetical protein
LSAHRRACQPHCGKAGLETRCRRGRPPYCPTLYYYFNDP